MSRIKGLEKLRKVTLSGINGFGTCVAATKETINSIINEIETEIEYKWMRAPIDADGAPIHVGDKLVTATSNDIIYTVTELRFDGRDWWYESGDDCFVCATAHHASRTLEDVLHDVWEEAIDYAKSYIWRNPDEVFAERADEIRAMFGKEE